MDKTRYARNHHAQSRREVDEYPWEQVGLSEHPMTGTVKSLVTGLFDRIREGKYSYGVRMPSERNLAEEFSVSRNSVRQALNRLQEYEIITRRVGSGSFVTYLPKVAKHEGPREGEIDFSDLAEITSLLELNVVRIIIEPEMVRLAVINMTARDLARLREILERMEQITTDAAEFSVWDETFHMQIAIGTRNPLLIAIYRIINHVRDHAHWTTSKRKTLSPKRIQDYHRKHRSIYEAIEARDIESAVEFVKLHMAELRHDLFQDA